MADDRDRAAAERADARDDRVIVGAGAVAVQLDPLVHEVVARSPACTGRPSSRASWTASQMSDSAARTARRRRRPRNGVGRRLFTPARRSCATAPCGLERRKRSTRATMPGGGAASPSTSIGTSVPPAHSRRMRPSSSLSSGRLTTASMRPCSRLDSARPKSSGSVSRVVSCTTRGPANESSASGSAIDEVAERRERRDHAARGGMGEHGDVRHAGLAQQVDGAHGLGHLHEREHVLLHARAARGRDRDERDAALGRDVARAREHLADDAAHRAAHEREVHACRARRACPRSWPRRRSWRRRAPWPPRPRSGARCTGADR